MFLLCLLEPILIEMKQTHNEDNIVLEKINSRHTPSHGRSLSTRKTVDLLVVVTDRLSTQVLSTATCLKQDEINILMFQRHQPSKRIVKLKRT